MSLDAKPEHAAAKFEAPQRPRLDFELPVFDFESRPADESNSPIQWLSRQFGFRQSKIRVPSAYHSNSSNNNRQSRVYNRQSRNPNRHSRFSWNAWNEYDPDVSPDVDDEQDNKDPDLVTWDGPDDKENPYNWSKGSKWAVTILASSYTLVSSFTSTAATPALDDIGRDFDIAAGFGQTMLLSIYQLGFTAGSFAQAPLSDMFGRVKVLEYSNIFYMIFNTACTFAQTKEQLYAFRLLSGIGGSAAQSLSNGVLADTWRPEEAGVGNAVFGIMGFIGPTMAPIVGAYMAENLDWRWIFYTTSIMALVCHAASLIWFKETYAQKLLGDKAARLRKETGNPRLHTRYEKPGVSRATALRKSLMLPVIMLVAHPAVQVPMLYRGFVYGIMMLVLFSFPQVWQGKYGMPRVTASLNFMSLTVGFIIGLQISGPLIDGVYAYFLRKQNGPGPGQEEKGEKEQDQAGLPEWRCPAMLVGAVITAGGLFLYGWAAFYQLHFVIADLGAVVFAAGLIIALQAPNAYMVDSYDPRHTASAFAVSAFIRTIFGFGFPLFAPAMYAALGLGWGNSLLGFVTLAVAVPAPIAIWFWGARLRAWSTAGLDY